MSLHHQAVQQQDGGALVEEVAEGGGEPVPGLPRELLEDAAGDVPVRTPSQVQEPGGQHEDPAHSGEDVHRPEGVERGDLPLGVGLLHDAGAGGEAEVRERRAEHDLPLGEVPAQLRAAVGPQHADDDARAGHQDRGQQPRVQALAQHGDGQQRCGQRLQHLHAKDQARRAGTQAIHGEELAEEETCTSRIPANVAQTARRALRTIFGGQPLEERNCRDANTAQHLRK
mmetsp:Transcript_57366/g.167948  ORF Transcript_57366/g.167948 Transcript_57366/m.167948 type:complete len:228 (-) Transcript_57366:286-969(-)